MKTLHELFEDGIKDMYNAEKQLIKALPKMAKLAKDQRLKEGFQTHLRQTEEHARRIEQACQSIGTKPSGMVCRAMKGLVEEANEHLQGMKASACTDAELIQLAQKVEHYEIGSYGTLCEWARLMGHDEAMNLLHQNLEEEKQTDELLSSIAEGDVNSRAAEESKQMMDGRNKRRSTTTRTPATARRSTGRSSTTRSGGRASTARATTRSTSGRTPARKTTTSTRKPAAGTKSPRGRASMR